MSDKDRCICDAGFGMNLSCPLHKPQGREYHEAIARQRERRAATDTERSTP